MNFQQLRLFKKIFLLSLLILICSCGKEQDQNVKKVTPDTNKKNPELYKGMFTIENSVEVFRDCTSKKKYVISDKSEREQLDRALATVEFGRNKSYYMEAQGFTSYQQNEKGNAFDTVLVVTKYIRLDTAKSCP